MVLGHFELWLSVHIQTLQQESPLSTTSNQETSVRSISQY